MSATRSAIAAAAAAAAATTPAAFRRGNRASPCISSAGVLGETRLSVLHSLLVGNFIANRRHAAQEAVDRPQIVVRHAAVLRPRHERLEVIARGIDAGANRLDEV